MSKRSSRKSQINLKSLPPGLAVLVALGAIVIFVIQTLTGSVAPSAPVTTVPPTSSGGNVSEPGGTLPWLTVYFTDPNPPDDLTRGIDRFVVPVLDAAKKTIDVTSFDFTLPSVTNALINAKKRGVAVRVILDEQEGNSDLKASESPDGKPFNALEALQKDNIPVANGGRSNGLMHNKMIIVDSSTLFMGSWNMSYNDTFRNNNNLLKITDPTLIANYQAKFNEGFVDKRFGAKAKIGAKTPKLTIDGVAVENYFSPVDDVMKKLVAEVNGARKSVKFIIYTYTHPDLSAAMVARFKVGVKVEGVIENLAATQGALVPLFCAKVPVKTDGNKYTMHHKVIIIDGATVITGSFNFTKSADDSNDDNILIIRSAAVAALYEQEEAKRYAEGKTPDGAKLTCK